MTANTSGTEMAALCDGLGKSADAGKAEDVKKAAAQLRTKLKGLRTIAK